MVEPVQKLQALFSLSRGDNLEVQKMEGTGKPRGLVLRFFEEGEKCEK
jgi:hypothetical protein